MRRREFLAAGVAVAGSVLVRPARAQPTAKRAAVVIGVDKAGDLPPLRAAKSGARAVAEFLRNEKYDVKLLIDEEGPVKAATIHETIDAYVKRGTISQLVVYFAGHGCVNSYAEYWLLSGAPDNANEAVSLLETAALAKQSGIPNVILISDACRSRADSLRANNIRGSIVFPNRAHTNVIPDVDQFLATVVGDPAWEVAIDESAKVFEGIYTACFLDAFKSPDETMVRTVGGVRVVPNKRLKAYLAREVPKRAQQRSITLIQRPDSQVNSDDDIYIARVRGTVAPAEHEPAATVRDTAAVELQRAGAGTLVLPPPTADSEGHRVNPAISRGFTETRNLFAMFTRETSDMQLRTGFSVFGPRVEGVATNPNVQAKILSSGDPAWIQVDLAQAPSASIAVRFNTGFGTVLAALDGYLGNVVVDRSGVRSVTYVPSRQHQLRSVYEHEAQRLSELHAAVTTAARYGVFRIDGPKEVRMQAAEKLADQIRMMKAIDPTLGLYAAYAYADAGLLKQVRSVMSYMRSDLRTDLFDVAMLAGDLRDSPPHVPFCPMLSQGWSLLRVKNARLPEGLGAAPDHLQTALWTTFDPTGIGIIESSLREGRLA